MFLEAQGCRAPAQSLMTLYEHVMLGVDGALAAGLHRRGGWQVVALAGCAAATPDWDAAGMLLSVNCYATVHRVWGHNLLVAGVLAALLAAADYRFDLLTRIAGRWNALVGRSSPPPRPLHAGLPMWLLVAVVAVYSHLLADMIASYCETYPVWRVPLLWPFEREGWALPVLQWGDVMPTLIFAAGMLAMACWRARIRPIAVGTLLALAAYIGFRALQLSC
jgi:membrane-bound metal-dependent hydrolase YbcI (DUF457 family)